MKNFDGDLMAYLALSEISKSEDYSMSTDDIVSKMKVHARKLKSDSPNIKFKW